LNERVSPEEEWAVINLLNIGPLGERSIYSDAVFMQRDTFRFARAIA